MKAKKALVLVLTMALAALGFSAIAQAADTDTQTVTCQVDAINEIEVSGNPGALTVSTATAGSQPDAATDNTTTYSITTNGTGMKITGAIDSDMPDNVTLKVNLAAPSGATSPGDVALSNTAADLVTGISQVDDSGKTIAYTLSATVEAGVVESTNKTVTFTLTSSGT